MSECIWIVDPEHQVWLGIVLTLIEGRLSTPGGIGNDSTILEHWRHRHQSNGAHSSDSSLPVEAASPGHPRHQLHHTGTRRLFTRPARNTEGIYYITQACISGLAISVVGDLQKESIGRHSVWPWALQSDLVAYISFITTRFKGINWRHLAIICFRTHFRPTMRGLTCPSRTSVWTKPPHTSPMHSMWSIDALNEALAMGTKLPCEWSLKGPMQPCTAEYLLLTEGNKWHAVKHLHFYIWAPIRTQQVFIGTFKMLDFKKITPPRHTPHVYTILWPGSGEFRRELQVIRSPTKVIWQPSRSAAAMISSSNMARRVHLKIKRWGGPTFNAMIRHLLFMGGQPVS